ncbi:MAG: thermonuclease family protein [Candidatus Levybacteria bacterium]|nr:thermonuclease family protein [Candidatus Levybacteria bacterium]
MKKIGIVFLIFTTGFLFGAAIFSQNSTPNKNQDVKSAISSATPTIQPTQTSAPTAATEKDLSSTDSVLDLYQVTKVIDGDTISVNIDGKNEVIRLLGIDSPESVDLREEAQCFGKEASDKAKILLTGKKVSLESDQTQGDRDKYKRLLRYVFLEDGTNFNRLMIELGYAHEYMYKTPYRYQMEFKLMEDKAREKKVGLWADNACASPIQGPTLTVVDDSFSCNGKTTCSQMASCDEAYFYLNSCGLSRLDADKDGVPCETLC